MYVCVFRITRKSSLQMHHQVFDDRERANVMCKHLKEDNADVWVVYFEDPRKD